MRDESNTVSPADAEQHVERLLRLAGARVTPPAEMRERVYAHVLEQWEQQPAPHPASWKRPGRRSLAAAAALLLGLVGTLGLWPEDGPPVAASVAFASGGYTVRGNEDASADQVVAGSMLITSGAGRVRLTTSGGVDVRLDRNTSVTFESDREVWLHEGSLYVDAGATGGGRKAPSDRRDAAVRVITRMGTITDVGTQFLVGIEAAGKLTVAVREGTVDIDLSSRTVTAGAKAGYGDVVGVDQAGVSVIRAPIADDRWAWSYGVSGGFTLAGHSVLEFLEWASREAGLTLRFDSRRARQYADLTTARGALTGYTPLEAIQAVLAGTDLRVRASGGGELLVALRSLDAPAI